MSSISDALGPLPPQFVVLEAKTLATGAPASSVIVAPNPLRWALLFSPPFDPTAGSFLSGFVAISPSPSGGTRYGLPVNANNTLALDFRRYGSLVQQSWYGFILGGTSPIDWYVIEVIIQQ